ncbi:uncharacterized protein LOC144908135 [Branchiostoma floridae x Branchiostoma belcheri]
MESCIDTVVSKVRYKWRGLARKLGFERGEIQAIRHDPRYPGPHDMCREMLERWIQKKTSTEPLQDLETALIEIGERRTAQSLGVNMEECINPVVISVSYKWENLAHELGFERGEIQAIQRDPRYPGPHDMCREMLERWIQKKTRTDPLQDLKTALIEIVNMEDCINAVVISVGYNSKWENLAHELGFERGEIQAIRHLPQYPRPDDDDMCREMLGRWIQKKMRTDPLQDLKTALIEIGERLTAESLGDLFPTSIEFDSIEVLAPEMVTLPLYSTRVPVMGQTRSGKTCLINRLMGQTDEPSTDDPQISSDAQTKLREKSPDTGDASPAQPSAIPGDDLGAVERGGDAGFTVEEDLRTDTAEYPRLSFCEFSGHATCYESPQCFSTNQGICILVMSLLQKLSDPVSDLDYLASVNNLRTGGDYLDYSLNSIRSHTLQHDTRQRADKGTTRPQVLIVLTHKDKVSKW